MLITMIFNINTNEITPFDREVRKNRLQIEKKRKKFNQSL